MKTVTTFNFNVENRKLLVLVAALVYFFCPLDLIPDFIAIVGYLDDIAAILYAIGNIK